MLAWLPPSKHFRTTTQRPVEVWVDLPSKRTTANEEAAQREVTNLLKPLLESHQGTLGVARSYATRGKWDPRLQLRLLFAQPTALTEADLTDRVRTTLAGLGEVQVAPGSLLQHPEKKLLHYSDTAVLAEMQREKLTCFSAVLPLSAQWALVLLERDADADQLQRLNLTLQRKRALAPLPPWVDAGAPRAPLTLRCLAEVDGRVLWKAGQRRWGTGLNLGTLEAGRVVRGPDTLQLVVRGGPVTALMCGNEMTERK